ncbi:Fis family transcriptional regulator [Nitrospira sp.]|nr:Fis family transcriptional regulator [Nitrospira sp.]
MGQTVLVVDDSPTMRQMVAFTLTSAGFQVVEAGDGKDALAKLSTSLQPALVVTDLNMPVMDGLTLIKELRKLPQLKFVPILMLTTESSTDKKAEGRSAGATGWIVKPFNPDQFMKVVKKVLPE